MVTRQSDNLRQILDELPVDGHSAAPMRENSFSQTVAATALRSLSQRRALGTLAPKAHRRLPQGRCDGVGRLAPFSNGSSSLVWSCMSLSRAESSQPFHNGTILY